MKLEEREMEDIVTGLSEPKPHRVVLNVLVGLAVMLWGSYDVKPMTTRPEVVSGGS